MKLLSMQFYPGTCYFVPLRPKISCDELIGEKLCLVEKVLQSLRIHALRNTRLLQDAGVCLSYKVLKHGGFPKRVHEIY